MKRRIFRIKLRIRRFARRHPWLTFTVRSFMIFSAAFGGAYGFISGSRVEGSGYDPHAFAIGASFLFALACLGLATLSFRLRWVRQKMQQAGAAQRSAGRPQLGTAGGRAARPQPVRIAGRPDRAARRRRPHHLRQRRLLRTGANCRAKNWSAAVLRSTCWSRATPRSRPTAHGSTTRRSRPRSARAGSPGAKAWSAAMPAGPRRCRASAATSPTAPRPSARSARPAITPTPPTAPSRASSRWPPTKSARR